MSTQNSLHAQAYQEMLVLNHHQPKLLWWLVSNLAEVDALTDSKLCEGVNRAEELKTYLFGFIKRASSQQLSAFNSLWQARLGETKQWLN
ncbi:hypothetical protein HUO09_16850 [Vibrio sp. Y2-5]|uniref:hypothetical protein n=1 Tax=Vibrio sp. Y2-5 TaxID=2743977 RepID=UPI0016604580|nr:hypothetical protein [Vibrio sp. Y2-5]MBD0788024.1 hypothetical protein [Vibrio sp. Y2-5]